MSEGITLSKTCWQALQIMQYVCTIAAEVDAYKKKVDPKDRKDWSGWSYDFCIDEIGHAFHGPEVSIGHFVAWDDKNYFNTDFWNKVFALPDEEKELLGFRKWDEKHKDMMLVPLWIVRCLPEDFKIKGWSISDEPVIISHDMADQDQRMGCIAYMV